jgi:hypothetical protein
LFRFANCGRQVRFVGRNGRVRYVESRCNDWRLCPYCCHVKRMEILRKFLPCFREQSFYLLTISFARSLNVEPWLDEPMWAYWAAAHYALKEMCLDHSFQGAIVLEECVIESYHPQMLILPHVHAVVRADQITPGQIEQLKALISSYDGRHWCGKRRRWVRRELSGLIEVRPVTQTCPLPELPDFSDALCYLVKPLDVYTPYANALADLRQQPGCELDWLNQDKNQTISMWELHKEHRYQHYYLGNMHASAKAFLGYGPKRRNTLDHKRHVAALLDEVNEARDMGYDSRFDPEHLNAPIEAGMLDAAVT